MSYPTFEHLYPNALRKHDANKPGIQPSLHVPEGVRPEPASWRKRIAQIKTEENREGR